MGKWRNQNKAFRRRSEFRPSRCFMICFKLDEIIPFSQVNMKHPPRNHVSIKRSFGTQLQGVLTIIFMVLAHNISILYISSFIYIYIYICSTNIHPKPSTKSHSRSKKKKTEPPLVLPWVTRLQQSFPASPLRPWGMRIWMMNSRISISWSCLPSYLSLPSLPGVFLRWWIWIIMQC